MTPEKFTAGLLASVRKTADGTADYLAVPPVKRPPGHLGRFATWFQRLSAAEQKVAREVILYAAEGGLFGVLTHLDNLAYLTDAGGMLELWWIGPSGQRVRLNDPDGELLTDLFNLDDEPDTDPNGPQIRHAGQ